MKASNLMLAIYLSFFFIMLGSTSCSEPEQELPFTCDSDALLVREDVSGTMFYLMCYDAWSVRLDETNEEGIIVYAASVDIEDDYKIEGLQVSLNACFYNFDLQLLFPDPAIWGDMYVMKDFEITSIK